jgi:hypothetical protein
LDSINLPEWLKELRDTLYIHLSTYYKGYYKGHRWDIQMEGCTGGGTGKGVWSFHALSTTPASRDLLMFLYLEHCRPCFIGFVEASLHMHDQLDHWWLTSGTSPLTDSGKWHLKEGTVCGTEASASGI